MERREFVGAALALFTGLAMPEPVLEVIFTHSSPAFPDVCVSKAVLERMLKEAYCEPIMSSLVVPQGELNKIFAGVTEAWDTGGDRYSGLAHYFEVG